MSRSATAPPTACSPSAARAPGSSTGCSIRAWAPGVRLQAPGQSVYIELHAASAFSFLQGASLPETLVDRAAALGYSALALLDADGVYGAPRFHKAAQRAGLRAIIGAELTIEGGREKGEALPPSPFPLPPVLWRLPVLVERQEGYQNLCRLITRMK